MEMSSPTSPVEKVEATSSRWKRFTAGLAKTRKSLKTLFSFRRALELDSQEHSVRLFYGWCLYYLGELAASREMFESFLAVIIDVSKSDKMAGNFTRSASSANTRVTTNKTRIR